MCPHFHSAPLVRWDDLHLVFDIPAVERILKTRLEMVEALSSPDLDGRDDRLSLALKVRWKSISVKVLVELREIRLRHRRLGFRLGRLRVLGGVPIPRTAVLRTIHGMLPDLMTILPGSDVVVIDLRTWIPPEVCLRIIAVQVVGQGLHVWLASGSVSNIPPMEHQQLAAGGAENSPNSGLAKTP